MESQNIEITFTNNQKQGDKFLKILQQVETNFSKSQIADSCQLGFQIQGTNFHVYTSQQKMVSTSSNNIFMLATFKKGFFLIKNCPIQTIGFGIRVNDLISKIMVCKKEIQQVKLIISKSTVNFHLIDKDSKGYINFPTKRLQLPVRDFEENTNELIQVGELSESYLQINKKSMAVQSLFLNEESITTVNQFMNIVYHQSVIRPPLDIRGYKFKDLYQIFRGAVMIKLFQSLNKNCAFFKNLNFNGVTLKIYTFDLQTLDQGRLILQFKNGDFSIIKSLRCSISVLEDNTLVIPQPQRQERGVVQRGINSNAPRLNRLKEQPYKIEDMAEQHYHIQPVVESSRVTTSVFNEEIEQQQHSMSQMKLKSSELSLSYRIKTAVQLLRDTMNNVKLKSVQQQENDGQESVVHEQNIERQMQQSEDIFKKRKQKGWKKQQ